MIAAGIVVAVIVIILLIPVGVRAEYSEEGIFLSVLAGLISIRVLPPKPKKPKKPKEKKQKKPKKAKIKSGGAEKSEKQDKKKRKKSDDKKPGTVALIMKLIPLVGRALNRFRKKLTINYLTLYYISASEDAFSTAMTFGYMSAGAGAVMNALSAIFNIRKYDIRTGASFTVTEPYVYIKAKLTIRIGQILGIAFGFLFGFIKQYIKLRKGGSKDGKASDRRSDGSNDAEDQGNG